MERGYCRLKLSWYPPFQRFQWYLQIGAVTSGISPVHTTASGQGINCAIIGKYAKFCVTCRNHSNQKVSQSREPLDVNLYAPDGNQIKVEMTTKPDSTYQFSYYPTTIGRLFIIFLTKITSNLTDFHWLIGVQVGLSENKEGLS